jgi:hypothetical protein
MTCTCSQVCLSLAEWRLPRTRSRPPRPAITREYVPVLLLTAWLLRAGATRPIKVMPAAMCDKSKIPKMNKDKSSPEDGRGMARAGSAGAATAAGAAAAGILPGVAMPQGPMVGSGMQAPNGLPFNLDAKDGA